MQRPPQPPHWPLGISGLQTHTSALTGPWVLPGLHIHPLAGMASSGSAQPVILMWLLACPPSPWEGEMPLGELDFWDTQDTCLNFKGRAGAQVWLEVTNPEMEVQAPRARTPVTEGASLPASPIPPLWG